MFLCCWGMQSCWEMCWLTPVEEAKVTTWFLASLRGHGCSVSPFGCFIPDVVSSRLWRFITTSRSLMLRDTQLLVKEGDPGKGAWCFSPASPQGSSLFRGHISFPLTNVSQFWLTKQGYGLWGQDCWDLSFLWFFFFHVAVENCSGLVTTLLFHRTRVWFSSWATGNT